MHWSAIHSFRTLPAVSPDTALAFAVLGDLGQTDDSHTVVQQLGADITSIQAVLHVGDLSYADGLQVPKR